MPVAGAQSTVSEKLTGARALRDEAIAAVAAAMRLTFVMIPIAGAGLLNAAALCMKREKLFGKAVDAPGCGWLIGQTRDDGWHKYFSDRQGNIGG